MMFVDGFKHQLTAQGETDAGRYRRSQRPTFPRIETPSLESNLGQADINGAQAQKMCEADARAHRHDEKIHV